MLFLKDWQTCNQNNFRFLNQKHPLLLGLTSTVLFEICFVFRLLGYHLTAVLCYLNRLLLSPCCSNFQKKIPIQFSFFLLINLFQVQGLIIIFILFSFVLRDRLNQRHLNEVLICLLVESFYLKYTVICSWNSLIYQKILYAFIMLILNLTFVKDFFKDSH